MTREGQLSGLNTTEVQLLLELQRVGSGTRALMGRLLGCSPATIFRASEGLVQAGWIQDTPTGDLRVGRPARVMMIRPEAAYVLAMHVSMDRTVISIVDATLDVVASETRAIDLHHTGPEDLLDALDPSFTAMLEQHDLAWPDVCAVAMALAGRTEYEAGRPVTPPNLPLWHGHLLREEMSDRWGLPAVLDNDANLMALGEGLRGGVRGATDFLYVNLDIGIGSGLILDGQLYRGSKGFSGELGHTTVGESTTLCACGKVGCLQAVASVPAVLARARARAIKHIDSGLGQILRRDHRITLRDLGAAAAAGDEGAQRIVSDAGAAIGGVLSGAVNLLNPDQIVLGGGVTALGSGLLAAIRRAVAKDTLPGSAQGLRIIMTELGDRAALIGAAALAVETIVSAGVVDGRAAIIRARRPT